MMKILSLTQNVLATLYICLSLSMSVYASDANLDTSTHIVTFPRVTVDSSSAFVNVQLLLNPDGTYQILSTTPEPEENINLSGNWKGTFQSSAFPGCVTQAELSLNQNGNELAGTWVGDLNCIGSGSGNLIGVISGNNIIFTLNLNGTEMKANIVLSDDRKIMTGSYSWPDFNDHGTWLISSQ